MAPFIDTMLSFCAITLASLTHAKGRASMSRLRSIKSYISLEPSEKPSTVLPGIRVFLEFVTAPHFMRSYSSLTNISVCMPRSRFSFRKPPMPSWIQAPSGTRSTMYSAILTSASLGWEYPSTGRASSASTIQVTRSAGIVAPSP